MPERPPRTLDRLFAANPDFNSTEADLLAARILEARGRLPEVLSAYERLSATYPDEEAADPAMRHRSLRGR
jgi:hypothetical protein